MFTKGNKFVSSSEVTEDFSKCAQLLGIKSHQVGTDDSKFTCYTVTSNVLLNDQREEMLSVTSQKSMAEFMS